MPLNGIKRRTLLPELVIRAVVRARVRGIGRAATLVLIPGVALLAIRGRIVLWRRGSREAAGLICQKKSVNPSEVGFHLRGRTYRRTSTNFQCMTKGSSSRTYPRSTMSIRWRYQHTSSHSRRAGVGLGWVLGDTTALVVIPKFVGLAHRVASHHRWSDKGEKSKGCEKARKARHSKKNGGGKRATSDRGNAERQRVNGLMSSWASIYKGLP